MVLNKNKLSRKSTLNYMFKKGYKIYSIFTGTCPKCHKESMYTVKNPYKLLTTLEMQENCSFCNTKYKMEPSFFYGAMYVSYGVGIAFATAAFIITHFVFNGSIHHIFAAIVVTLIVSLPIILRLSRNIWINLFIHYDKKAS